MKIETYQPPKPPKVYRLEFSREDGWAVVAALADFARKNPNANNSELWRDWANELDRLLRNAP
jgi:hypothetical protein